MSDIIKELREHAENASKVAVYLASTAPTAIATINDEDWQSTRRRCEQTIALAAEVVKENDLIIKKLPVREPIKKTPPLTEE